MKRISLLIIIAILYCCCTTNGSDGQDNESGVAPMDSVVEASDSEVVELEPEPPFTSPDLKWQHLQGRVKKVVCSWHDDYGTSIGTYRFNKEGKFTSYSSNLDVKYSLRRNKNGQIVEWWWCEDETDNCIQSKYIYNGDGYVCKETGYIEYDAYKITYALNDKGWYVSSKCVMSDYDEDEVYSRSYTTFSYSNIDEHGNWCKCIEKTKIRNTDGGSRSETLRITRKITYWE